MSSTTDLPMDIPVGETPAARCPYCDRPFTSELLRVLHVGERHEVELSAEERAAYEEAYAAESDDLFVFHLKVVAALVILFMGIGYVYAFALS